jgi:hypothetical protein
MPNGGLPNCMECMHKSNNERCELYGTKISPYLLCRQYEHSNDKDLNEHLAPYLEPFQPGTVYWIDNFHGANQDHPLPAFQIMSIRYMDSRYSTD